MTVRTLETLDAATVRLIARLERDLVLLGAELARVRRRLHTVTTERDELALWAKGVSDGKT